MATELEGIISEITISKNVDFGSENIGPCWIKRNEKTKREINNFQNIINTGKRMIFIPSEKRELIDYMIQQIDGAHDGICMSSFLIQSGDLTNALLRASDRGVKVFLLTTKEDDLKKADDELTEFEKRNNIIDEHKDLLDSFAGKILVRTSPDFHAKYFIVDPHSLNPFGLIMTCNATVDAMQGSKNIEIALSLKNEEIKSLFSHFIHGFWKMANHELFEKSKLDSVKRDIKLDIDFGEITSPSTCINLNSLKMQILQFIKNASKSLIITAWSFDKDYVVLTAINDAIERGVKVYVFTRPNYRNTNALLTLVAKGANVFGYDRFHAKSLIVDGNHGLITTANFTKLGLESGFEVSILLDKHEIDFLKNVVFYWNSLCDWKLDNNPSLNNIEDEFMYPQDKNDDLIVKVIPENKKQLPAIKVKSCEEMLTHSISEKYIEDINSKEPTEKAKKITVTQLIKPAIMPKNVIEEKRDDSPFPVYHGKKKSEKYILVKTWDDLKNAQDYARKLNANIVINGE